MSQRELTNPGASIAILAGGKSRRMGSNKALLPLPPAGETILARQCRVLRPLTDDLMIIGPSIAAYQALPARLVNDAYPGAGPLGGVATALAAARHPACLMVACDLPLLEPALAAHLLKQSLATRPAIVPAVTSDGQARLQPLLAVYHVRALPMALACLARGERRLGAFVAALRATIVAEPELRAFDPTLESFLNTNDPASYATVLNLLAARHGLDAGDEPS